MTEEHPLALHPLAMEMIAEPETDALTLAWRTEQEIVRLKRRVAKLEEERLLLIDEAREAGRTYRLPPEHRQKIGIALTGRPCSDETRAKLSAAMKGPANGMRGKKHTPETKAKISESLKGSPRPKSEAQREKLSLAAKGNRAWAGKHHTEETRKKISSATSGANNARWGKPFPQTSRAKISSAKRGKYCGPAASGWRGGVSFEPYCFKFNDEFKERVREFFGRVCVECGAPENGVRLSVHHVNHRKDACCAEGAAALFVPLCRTCHGKSNSNREYWEARFTALINERYGGRCYLPKEVRE